MFLLRCHRGHRVSTKRVQFNCENAVCAFICFQFISTRRYSIFPVLNQSRWLITATFGSVKQKLHRSATSQGADAPFEALRGSNCSAPPASAARKFPFIKTSTSWFCFFLGSLLSEIRTFHPSISTSLRSRQTRLRTFSLCSDQLFLGFGVAAAAGSCAGTHRLHKQPIYSLFGNTRV